MARVRLVVWNEQEATERGAELRAMGFDTDHAMPAPGATLPSLRASPPDAIVIHLGRLPSHGREVAMGIRSSKTLREIPIIFADGDPVKVEALRQKLPDATYTSWGKIKSTIQKVMKAPRKPVMPTKSALDAYSGTPLPKKLGIKEGSRVLLINPPRSFFKAVDPVPKDVDWLEDTSAERDLAILFIESWAELARHIDDVLDPTAVWVAYPKGNVTEVTQNAMRDFCLTKGLVDYKVCSIDAKWTGLLFRRRKGTTK